jgi:hypothetical protein
VRNGKERERTTARPHMMWKKKKKKKKEKKMEKKMKKA